MLIFAVIFLIILILIQIPVLKHITYFALFVILITAVISLGYFYNEAKNRREAIEGVRK